MKRLDLNDKTLFLANLEFQILKIVREKDGKFRKIQIFDCNLYPNCFTVENSSIRRLDFNTIFFF